MKAMKTTDVKHVNRETVLAYIYRKRSTTQQEIREALQLSRPTVIQVIKEFEEAGLIARNGFLDSTGGRKASSICFSEYARISVGVELLAEQYEIIVLDLYGQIIKREKHRAPFAMNDAYYAEVCSSVNSLAQTCCPCSQHVLGVGIVLQGLICADGSRVTYGKILGCTGLSTEVFSAHLNYPCQFFHDAETAARNELWQSSQLQDAIYINIRGNMSGAILVNRQFLKGVELKSGVFEHMTIIPDGIPCYCGSKGCLEAYCSLHALLGPTQTLIQFFTALRTGDSACRTRWLNYLRYLAIAINNLHMFMDCDVILGGTIASFLQGGDLKLLHEFVRKNTAFPSEREFIHISRCPDLPIGRGAALFYVQKYLQSALRDFSFSR